MGKSEIFKGTFKLFFPVGYANVKPNPQLLYEMFVPILPCLVMLMDGRILVGEMKKD